MTVPLLASGRLRTTALTLGALWALGACGGTAPDAPASNDGAAVPGRLVIVGGGLAPDNEAVYRAVLDGRDGSGPVCVLPTAGGDPEASMASAVDRLDGWGGPGTARGILIAESAPERADDPAVASQLRECGGFYFTGGSQSRVVDTFLPAGRSTLAYEALMERWRGGAVVAGSSAGAAMMGRRMIAGGGSLEALEHGVVERGPGDDDGVIVGPGMGFFDQGWLDQHFLARGRWGRLLVASMHAPAYDVGLGIDENTALVVDGAVAEVVGASGVVILDARSDLTLDLLGAGDRVDLTTLVVTPAAGREPAPAPETEPGTDPDRVDPFERWRLLRDLARTAPAREGLAYRAGDGTVLELQPLEGFRAQAAPGGAGQGPEGTARGLSAGPYRVVLTPPAGG